MEIKILFDSIAVDQAYSIGWGFSCLIDGHILFDTGESYEFLFNNMNRMNIDRTKLTAIVLSHEHWDHVDGVWEIVQENKNIPVYCCPHFSLPFKDDMKKTGANALFKSTAIEIEKNIFTTGEIASLYKNHYLPEQALVLRTENGISIITGCAHPGITHIIDIIKGNFPNEKMYCVLGGFHLKDKDINTIEKIVNEFRINGIQKVAPAHCTGERAVEGFKKQFGEGFVSVQVGKMVSV
ncbi:MBL fold metallo-hydrolase [Desulfosarcina sp.]|nr:MBL fold metallo-hydrolase [Desulfosarcina sp.]